MKSALHAIYWELFWKNKLVFPALGILLGIGATAAKLIANPSAGADWLPEARYIALMAFLISVLIGYAPFTLMESSGGWKMNSMVTRWFALPVRTVYLVYLPLLAACAFMAALILAWLPVLNRITGGVDGLYMAGVFVTAQIFINTLSWTVPRKPLQFWVGLGLLFPLVLVLTIGPMDQPGKEQFRHALLALLSVLGIGLGAFNLYAACRNRSGVWPGELPFERLWQWAFPGSTRARRSFQSPMTALLQCESLPILRLIIVSWAGLVLLLFLWAGLLMRARTPQLAFSLRLLVLLATGILPGLGVVWMAGLSLFAAGEPASLFRSRLSSFRATLPVSSGVLAGQRLVMLLVGWAMLWLPLVGLSYLHSENFLGIPVESTKEIQMAMARFMAVGAFVAVGALPFLLLGRCDGFPNVLLASVVSWAFAWALVHLFSNGPGEEIGGRWALLGAFLALKVGFAVAGFATGLRRGHITWRFPALVIVGWAIVSGSLIWAFPTWAHAGAWPSLCLLSLVPLARLAWCPVAIASNRHRS